jgi:Tfp pilus assembly protein PilN
VGGRGGVRPAADAPGVAFVEAGCRVNQINFLPKSFMVQQARKKRVVREIGLVAVVVMAMGVWLLVSGAKVRDLRDTARDLKSQAESLSRQVGELDRMRADRERLIHQVRIQRELGQPVSHSAVITALSHELPDAVTMTRLSMRTRRPAPSKAAAQKPDDRKRRDAPAPPKESDLIRIEIDGCAPDDVSVANFVGRLSEYPLFTNVKMIQSRATTVGDRVEAREFRIELEVPLDRDYQTEPSQEVASAN